MVNANIVKWVKKLLMMEEPAGRRTSGASLMREETKMEPAQHAPLERLLVKMAPGVKENAEIILAEAQEAHAFLILVVNTPGYSSLVTVRTAHHNRKLQEMEGHASVILSAQTTRETMAVVSASKTTVARPPCGIDKVAASHVILVKKLHQMV